MRIIELPFALSPGGAFALAPLVAREDKLNVGFTVQLANGYDFTGGTPPESYSILATHNLFSQSATLLADYPAETNTLDFDVRLHVHLTGVDATLGELDDNSGLANELLIFIGDEIMSLVAVELVGAGIYMISVARERFGTARAAHAARSEMFIIAKADLLALTHPSFLPGVEVALKVAITSGRFTAALDDLDAITHTMTGSSLALPPSNLRVNGEQRNATFGAGLDVRIGWSLPAQRIAINSSLGLRVRTLVEIVGAGDAVLWSKLTYQPRMKILGAKMTAILGAETEFDVRLTTDILGPEFHLVSHPITLHAIQT